MTPIMHTSHKEQFDFFSALVDGDVDKTAGFLDKFDSGHYFPKKFIYKNIASTKYSTPIHIACGLGMVALTDLLFQKQKNKKHLLSLKNHCKQDTSIHLMIRNNQLELIMLLYHTKFSQFRKCLTIANTTGYTPFLLATKHPDPRYLELFIRGGSYLDTDLPQKKGALELIFCSRSFTYKKFDFKNTAYYTITGSEKIRGNFEKFMRLRLLLHSFAIRQTKIQEALRISFPVKTKKIIFDFILLYDCNPRIPKFDTQVKQECIQALTLPLCLQLIHDTYTFVANEWQRVMQNKQTLGKVRSFEQIATEYLIKNIPHLSQTTMLKLPKLIQHAAAKLDPISPPPLDTLSETSPLNAICLTLSQEYGAILPEILNADALLFKKDWQQWTSYFTRLTKTKTKI